MATVLTSLLSNSDVKQGLEKGPQGIAHAAIGLVEQFATKGLIGKVLPGVGMVNPLLGIFTEPVVSALKAQLNAQVLQPIFGGGPTQALNMVAETGGSKDMTGLRQVVSRVEGFLPRIEVRSVGDDSFKHGAFDTLYPGAKSLSLRGETSALEGGIDARLAPTKPFATEKFNERRQVLHTNPMAMGTETHGIVLSSTEERIEKARANGGSNIKATDGVFTSTKESKNTVLGFAAKDTGADLTLPPRAQPVTSIIDSVFHNALVPQTDPNSPKVFNAEKSEAVRAQTGDKLSAIATETPARDPATFSSTQERTDALYSGLKTKFDNSGIQGAESGSISGRGHALEGTTGIRRYKKRAFGGVISEEFLQQHRFLVFDATEDSQGLSIFEWESGQRANSLAAGFSYCDAPTMSIVTESVKEGTWEFPRQIPIGVEAGHINLQKGMVRTVTSFYLWIEQFLRGNVTRRTLKILAYGRSPRTTTDFWNRPETNMKVYGEWTLYNCAPIRYAAGQGWDARVGEIQVAELEIGYEWFEEASPEDMKRVANL